MKTKIEKILMNKKLVASIAIALELVIAIFFASRAFKSDELINTSMAQWQSSTFQYEDDAWHMSDELYDGASTADLVGPFITLGRGSYVARVDYSADVDGEIVVNTGSSTAYRLGTRKLTLPCKMRSIDVEFETTGTVENIGIGFFYGNSGDLTIKNITMYKTNEMEKRHLFECIMAFVLINLVYIFRAKIGENKKVIASMIAIAIFSSVALFSYGHGFGHDLEFHLMRIEGIKTELMAGHFPVKMQSIWNYNHGYPVSIYYCDVLLYFPALLRVFGIHLLPAYKIYVFCLNLATAVMSYCVGKKIWNKDYIAVGFSAAFTLSTYRLVCLYVRSALGEYTAMLFFPLIMYGLFEIYFAKTEKEKLSISGIITLTIGMTGIVTCHILSAEMVTVVLIIFALLLWKTTFKKNVFVSLVISAVSTLMLSLWFIVPFLDYYKNVDVNVNQVVGEGVKIQDQGAYITQFFAVFKTHFGGKSEYITMRSAITPGLILMITLFVVIALWVDGRATKTMKKLTVASLVLFFVSSNVFPWNRLGENKLGNMLSQIQFPYRYVGFVCLILAILFACLLQYIDGDLEATTKKVALGIVFVIFSLQIAFDISSYANDAVSIYNPQYVTDLSGENVREYFRAGSDEKQLSAEVVGDGVKSARLVSRHGSDYVFKINTNDSGEVTLPVMNYKGYQVKDEAGKAYAITDGEENEITVQLPADFSGKLYVSFVEPIYWRIAEIISVISLITFVGFLIYIHNGKKHDK